MYDINNYVATGRARMLVSYLSINIFIQILSITSTYEENRRQFEIGYNNHIANKAKFI